MLTGASSVAVIRHRDGNIQPLDRDTVTVTPNQNTAGGQPRSTADRPVMPPPGGMTGPPPFLIATTVGPTDTSTSIVVEVDVTNQVTNGAVDLDTRSDITFASHTLADGTVLDLKLDLVVPKTDGAKPLVVYLPGGGFLISAKNSQTDCRTHVAEAGFAVASIEYRTVLNGSIYADGVADVNSAIRYLRAHADQYGLDTSRVGVWGESAGGYLAAMAGATVYGRGSGTTFADDPDTVARANPTTYIGSSTPPYRYVLQGAKHGDLAFLGDLESGLPWSTRQVMGYVIDFLYQHLKA